MDTPDQISPQGSECSYSDPAPLTAADMMKAERIDIPSENDVLCGRGGSINSHKGNEHFRALVEKRKRVYLTARFKREKRLIASSIVSEIRALDPPGRFLARKGNKDHGYWYDIGDEKARDKTSQALRENAPSIRAEIETEITQQREEMKRQESEEAKPQKQPTPPSYPAPIHPYYDQHRSYWEWYYHYYGFPPPPPPGHYPHAAPPGAHPAPPVMPPPPPPPPPGIPPPPPGYWAHPPPTRVRDTAAEEFKEDCSNCHSQEEEDHRIALELQQQEKEDLLEERKKRARAGRRSAQSSAFFNPFSNSSTFTDSRKPKHMKTASDRASRFEASIPAHLSQEEKDLRLALALQEEEDKVLRHQLEASVDSSRRTSRSNAYSQITRASRDSFSLDQMVPASFVSWVKSDTGRRHSVERDTSQRSNFSEISQRSVQFKDDSDDMMMPRARDLNHSPVLQRQNSAASLTRPLQPQAEPNSSLLSHVANHILGSWDTSHAFSRQHPTADTMETEGHEVSLNDNVRDESRMPPPHPVGMDWPSRVACHSWFPETLGMSWGGQAAIRNGISPVNSLEMDNSNNDHSSLGGGSLCHVFEPNLEESMQRALQQVPSWERSMRSKSPTLSMCSDVDEDEMIRVRDSYHPKHNSMAPMHDPHDADMDWEEDREHG